MRQNADYAGVLYFQHFCKCKETIKYFPESKWPLDHLYSAERPRSVI